MSAAMYRVLMAMIACILFVSMPAPAQIGSLSGPVLGYVFDKEAGRLRSIHGILGSATIGEPLAIGEGISQAMILDAFQFIVSTNGSARLLRLAIDDGAASVVDLPDIPSNPSFHATSAQGTAIALYFAETKQLRILATGPKGIRLAGLLELEQPLTTAAVNNEGTLVVYAVRHQNGDALYSWSPSSSHPRFLTTAISVSGIAITRSGDAIVSDRGSNEVFAIRDANGGAVRRLIAAGTDGVSNPVGLIVSSSDRIYVANAGSGTVMAFESSGRLAGTHRCNCAISGIFPFRDSVFRLTEGIPQTIYLLDATSAAERIVFVPPPQEKP